VLLEDKSVSDVLGQLQQDQEGFLANVSTALLKLFSNGARFEPPLGLSV
jgi:hypothetical protein